MSDRTRQAVSHLVRAHEEGWTGNVSVSFKAGEPVEVRLTSSSIMEGKGHTLCQGDTVYRLVEYQ